MNLRSMIWALAALAGSVGLATAQHAAVQLEAAHSPIVSEDGPVVEAVTQPGTYQRDNGTLTTAWGAGDNEILGMQPFTAAGGSDVITSISTKWDIDMPIGRPAKIAVWQDVGTGIGGAQLLHVQGRDGFGDGEYVQHVPTLYAGLGFGYVLYRVFDHYRRGAVWAGLSRRGECARGRELFRAGPSGGELYQPECECYL